MPFALLSMRAACRNFCASSAMTSVHKSSGVSVACTVAPGRGAADAPADVGGDGGVEAAFPAEVAAAVGVAAGGLDAPLQAVTRPTMTTSASPSLLRMRHAPLRARSIAPRGARRV